MGKGTCMVVGLLLFGMAFMIELMEWRNRKNGAVVACFLLASCACFVAMGNQRANRNRLHAHDCFLSLMCMLDWNVMYFT